MFYYCFVLKVCISFENEITRCICLLKEYYIINFILQIFVMRWKFLWFCTHVLIMNIESKSNCYSLIDMKKKDILHSKTSWLATLCRPSFLLKILATALMFGSIHLETISKLKLNWVMYSVYSIMLTCLVC